MPKYVLRPVLGKKTVHPSCDSPNTSRRFSRLVQAMSAWLVETRRALSRHSWDAGVYGHTTTAMHKLSTPPHTTTLPHLSNSCIFPDAFTRSSTDAASLGRQR